MCGCCVEHLLGYFRCRVIKLLACLCQVGTSAHLITDKWGFVPASVRINPFCKHSYPNLLNMPLANQRCTSIALFKFYISCWAKMRSQRSVLSSMQKHCEHVSETAKPCWGLSPYLRSPRAYSWGAFSLFCCLPSQQSQSTWWRLAVLA